jgi:hypothetical protein
MYGFNITLVMRRPYHAEPILPKKRRGPDLTVLPRCAEMVLCLF